MAFREIKTYEEDMLLQYKAHKLLNQIMLTMLESKDVFSK